MDETNLEALVGPNNERNIPQMTEDTTGGTGDTFRMNESVEDSLREGEHTTPEEQPPHNNQPTEGALQHLDTANNELPTELTETEDSQMTAQEMRNKLCEEEFHNTFKPNTIYPTPQLLYQEVCNIAAKHNFSVSKDGTVIKCSRAVDKAKEKKRQKKKDAGLGVRGTRSIQVECPFKITWN